MEVKGIGWLLVGMVTCASTDFFVANPQLMLVDITDLGTIKLQMEVTWKYRQRHHTSIHAHTHRHTKYFVEPLSGISQLFVHYKF